MNNESPFTTLPEIIGRTFLGNELSFAFLTNIPITPGHTLICPRRVVLKIDELTEQELKSMHELLILVKARLEATLEVKGFNYAWNEGKDFGQSVPHFHLHVVREGSVIAESRNSIRASFLTGQGLAISLMKANLHRSL